MASLTGCLDQIDGTTIHVTSSHAAVLAPFCSGRIPEWRNARAHNLPASKRGNTGVPAARREKNKRSKSRG